MTFLFLTCITNISTIQALSLKVTFDDILEEVGGFGRYQKVLISIITMNMTMTMTMTVTMTIKVTYFLLFLPTIFSAMQKQSWYCKHCC